MLTHKKLERILHVSIMMMILALVIFGLGEILIQAIEYDACCVTIN
jgi:hypothetical protein